MSEPVDFTGTWGVPYRPGMTAPDRSGDQSQALDRCSYCGTRVGNDPFTYRDRGYCCNCMSALCSWLLDGGTITDPDMFDVAVES